MPNTFWMDTNGSTPGFGTTLTANFILNFSPLTVTFGTSALGTTAYWNQGTATDDTLNFGSASAATVNAGTLTLNSGMLMGNFATANLIGSAFVDALNGTYLGQRITGPFTLTIGSAGNTRTVNLSGNSIFMDPSALTMAGTLDIISNSPGSGTPAPSSSFGLNLAGADTTGITGTINVTSGFLKLVNRLANQSFLADATTVTIAASQTMMVQKWANVAGPATVRGTFQGDGAVRLQGWNTADILFPNNVTFTGSLTGLTGSGGVILWNGNTATVPNLPTTGTLYIEADSSATSTLTVNASGSPTYLANGIRYFNVAAHAVTLASLGSSGFTISGGLHNHGSLATTLTLSGTATGNVLAGNASIPGGGALGLTKTGSGSWEISGANSEMAGAITVTLGTLRASTNNTALGTGNVTMSSGTTLELSGGITVTNATNNIGSISSVSGSNSLAPATGGMVLVGATTFQASLGASLTINPQTAITGAQAVTLAGAGNVTVSQAFSQATTLTKSGAGTGTLSSASNSFSGDVTISGGKLSISSNGAIGGNGTGLTLQSDGVLLYTGSTGITMTRSLTAGSITGGFENDGNSALMVTTGAITGTSTVKLGGTGSGQYNTLGATVAAGGFTKQGPGRWITTASNNLTGTTLVSAGTLMAANSDGASKKLLGGNVTVSAGAKIQTGSDNNQKGQNNYTNLTFAGASGNPAKLRIGGSAVNPTVQMSGNLTLPASGTTTFDLSADVFKTPGTYTLIEFTGVFGVVGGSIAGKISYTGTSRSAAFTYNTPVGGPNTITVTIS